ncbi:stigma-specific STIG1-like protein 1 [Rosa chinensis]|nr:stigma-specific STIG1-like protein 1 [Rosa chinensis]
MAIVSAEYLDDYNNEEMQIQNTESTVSEMQEATTSLRGVSRFLTQQNPLASVTCDKLPRVCRLKKSPGSDCCKKKCVNLKTDRLNCGMCGYKCKYTEICCRGKCVNASFDEKHCGGCNQKCKKGEFCVLGMCNYA